MELIGQVAILKLVKGYWVIGEWMKRMEQHRFDFSISTSQFAGPGLESIPFSWVSK